MTDTQSSKIQFNVRHRILNITDQAITFRYKVGMYKANSQHKHTVSWYRHLISLINKGRIESILSGNLAFKTVIFIT